MIELVLQSPDFERFRPGLMSREREGCVVLFTHSALLPNGASRLLEADYVVPSDEDYLRRGHAEAELSPAFVATVTKRAGQGGLGLVFVHSHPGSLPPRFSKTDDEGEKHLARFLRHRVPNAIHVALVVSKGGMAARTLGTQQHVRVYSVGTNLQQLTDNEDGRSSLRPLEHDRQIRVFGAEGQRRLSQLCIGIVGLGGTGSIVAQELAHLGVRKFLLIDPDSVERTNLNRLANASSGDLGVNKVNIAQRYILNLEPTSQVETLVGDVMRADVAKRLIGADFIFGCTDSHGSRSVIQQVAYQYLIPCVDMGSTIVVEAGRISHIHGRVQLLAPGLPCLVCSGTLNSNEVRQDMMTPLERQSDPYIVGERIPAPSVMSLNGTVASLGVTMFLAVAVEFPSSARHLLYNAITSSIRIIAPKQDPECFLCSRAGFLSKGDQAPLLARQD